MSQSDADFTVAAGQSLATGLRIAAIDWPSRQAQGRAAWIDLTAVGTELHVFADLVNADFGTAEDPQAPGHASAAGGKSQARGRLGKTLAEFVFGTDAGEMAVSENGPAGPLFACNTLHTNFVRGNGFLVVDGKLIYKPRGAVGLDGHKFVPLHGDYTMLRLSPLPPAVLKVHVADNRIGDAESLESGISGPWLVRQRDNVAADIPQRRQAAGQTVGDEVNFCPSTTRTSFTAFGVDAQGRLLCVSMFAGTRVSTTEPAAASYFAADQEQGVTLVDMATLLIRLGAVDAIAGGGSGDTQQFIAGQSLYASLPRQQRDRVQVGDAESRLAEKIRGVGGILAVCTRDR